MYAPEFEHTGMTRALNRYTDRDREDLARYGGAPIKQASLFIGGAWTPSRQSWAVNRATAQRSGVPIAASFADVVRAAAAWEPGTTATDCNHGWAVAHMTRLPGLACRIRRRVRTAAGSGRRIFVPTGPKP